MANYWKDKTIWITGASSGIGKALSTQLAERGARLILSSRRPETLKQLRHTIHNSAVHRVLAIDVSDPENVQRMLSEHEDLIKTVDVLINNAGISQRALTWEATMESERHIMETNFFGATALASAVLPSMVERNDGAIINMSSVTGKFGFLLRSSYAASKHALHGYFDSLRAELDREGKNIHVMLVCPGRIATDISKSALTADGSKQEEMDPGLAAGMDPNVCARKIISAAERRKAEIYIGKEQILIYLKRYFPGLFRAVVSKIKPK